MRRREKKQISYEKEVTAEVTCDLCGRRALGELDVHRGPNWAEDGGRDNVQLTQVELQVGWSYSGDAGGDVWTYDICPDCFKDRLMPWLKEQGAELRTYDY